MLNIYCIKFGVFPQMNLMWLMNVHEGGLVCFQERQHQCVFAVSGTTVLTIDTNKQKKTKKIQEDLFQ